MPLQIPASSRITGTAAWKRAVSGIARVSKRAASWRIEIAVVLERLSKSAGVRAGWDGVCGFMPVRVLLLR